MGKWDPSDDFKQIVDLCISFNKGRLYETFWQYSLTEEELVKQYAKAWLYTTGDGVSEVALSRRVNGVSTVEELWGDIRGFFGDQRGTLSAEDSKNVKECSQIFDAMEKPARLRVPLDNHFGVGVAYEFGFKG